MRGLEVALALSLGLHALLTFNRRFNELPVVEAPPIEVISASPAQPRSQQKRPRGGKVSAPIPASHLAIVPRGEGPAIGAFRTGGGIGSRYAVGDSPEQTIRDTGTYSRLYEIIDQALDYPDELSAREEEGVVQARLVFGTDGKYDRERSIFSAPSNFLRVHVARTMRRALTESIGKRAYSLTVRCSFEFRVRSGPLVRHRIVAANETAPDSSGARTQSIENLRAAADKSAITGGYLYFYREHNAWRMIVVDSVFDDRTNKASNATGLDLLPLIESGADAIGDLFSKKAKRDPLDNYRDDPEWTK